MLFKYEAIDKNGDAVAGTIEAISENVAISSVQNRGLVISSIKEEKVGGRGIVLFERVSNKDIVILSRQISTLFEAHVSALRVFRLLSSEVENPLLQRVLSEVASDLQGGSSISKALGKHPKAFSAFYVNMVKAGEESGKLDETFVFLADYLDRTYEVTSKAKNALIYPAFVITTFVAVMVLMMTTVIPKISGVLEEAGQDIPFYTKVVLGMSNFFVNYGVFILIVLVVGGFMTFRYSLTEKGKLSLSRLKISVPYIGNLYKKLYLSRLADNMHTMLLSGIPMVRAIEITAEVVDNAVYEKILKESAESIRGGMSVSDALSNNDEIPNIMIQMVRIGEETGELGNILKTLAYFYRREVSNAVDTLVDLIEPVMIVLLGVGVGVLLASVLIPIYNISSAI